MILVVVVELAEGEVQVVVVGFYYMVAEGLVGVGEQEAVALPSAVKRHKEDMELVPARKPIDFISMR